VVQRHTRTAGFYTDHDESRLDMGRHELINRITYQAERYSEIREQAFSFAEYISVNCPPSREQSLAFTALEECVMWANASIALNE
jgi:hypothetical protein